MSLLVQYEEAAVTSPDNNNSGLPFDREQLSNYLRQHLDCGSPGTEPALTPISGGFSNPTYFLKFSDSADYVLRKKPAGPLLPSAHAIDREFRVMQALADTGVPVPKMLHYCEDDRIVGTPFYIMERVQGRVLHDNTLPDFSAAERGQYYAAMNETLARLHSVDFNAVGLGDFGKTGGFIERQIRRWSSQYEKSKSSDVAEIEQLGRWLAEHLPNEDETTIVHGDFRLGNLMFHPQKPEVVAVLDWELSTLGHPMSDLGYNLMVWKMRSDEFHGIADQDFSQCGIPAFEDYIAAYYRHRGLGGEFNPFYLAFSFFRLAVIFDGVINRGGGDPNAHPGVDISQLNRVFAGIGMKVAQGRI
jgi:aminoglycoside phosphotransferase (APT) family kinase protein